MRGLKGKRVLITGGASGIGAATAARFLEEGARVCVLDRDPKALEQIRRKLPTLAGIVAADVSNLEQVHAGVRQRRDPANRFDQRDHGISLLRRLQRHQGGSDRTHPLYGSRTGTQDSSVRRSPRIRAHSHAACGIY